MSNVLTPDQIQAALHSWTYLNMWLINATEEICQQLLDAEQRGKKRRTFLMRIHSRYNRVRAERERGAFIAVEGMRNPRA